MTVIETERLTLRRLSVDDADFILNLLNQPSFIRFIGDRGVRNLPDARLYIESRFVESYRRFGYGLYLVGLKDGGAPVGICGLVRRDYLPDADIGFAFLPEYWSRGYASESAGAVLDYARGVLGLKRVLAITAGDNEGSAKVLAKIGLKFERMIKPPGEGAEVKLFSWDA
jgi:RimJ/RimL family protein N-acetyltransferase